MMKGLTCTTILYIVVIFGFAINYMLRVNMSIAIVDMLESNSTSNQTHNVTRFNWTIIQKNELLGCFFWGYTLSLIIGGRLSEIFGTKIVYGYGIFLASIATIAMPFGCEISYYFALSLRTLTGLFLGITFPSIFPIAVNWIPPMDRSKFTSNLMAQGIGAAVTLPVCGLLISIFQWKVVFYCTGCVGIVWSIAWYFLIYNDPDEHPRISTAEKINIRNKRGCKDEKTKPKNVPWGQMFRSLPVWALLITTSANGLYHFTYVAQLPTYMKDVLKFDVRNNGLLSCLPFIGQYTFAVISSYIADKMRKSKKFSTTTTRKIFTSIALIIPALLMTCLATIKQSRIISVIELILMHSFQGCISAGWLANYMDLTPNYSATLLGISVTISSAIAWLGTKIVGILTKERSDFESWRNVFLILAIVDALGAVVFILGGSGETQEWNDSSEKVEEESMRNEFIKNEQIMQ